MAWTESLRTQILHKRFSLLVAVVYSSKYDFGKTRIISYFLTIFAKIVNPLLEMHAEYGRLGDKKVC